MTRTNSWTWTVSIFSAFFTPASHVLTLKYPHREVAPSMSVTPKSSLAARLLFQTLETSPMAPKSASKHPNKPSLNSTPSSAPTPTLTPVVQVLPPTKRTSNSLVETNFIKSVEEERQREEAASKQRDKDARREKVKHIEKDLERRRDNEKGLPDVNRSASENESDMDTTIPDGLDAMKKPSASVSAPGTTNAVANSELKMATPVVKKTFVIPPSLGKPIVSPSSFAATMTSSTTTSSAPSTNAAKSGFSMFQSAGTVDSSTGGLFGTAVQTPQMTTLTATMTAPKASGVFTFGGAVPAAAPGLGPAVSAFKFGGPVAPASTIAAAPSTLISTPHPPVLTTAPLGHTAGGVLNGKSTTSPFKMPGAPLSSQVSSSDLFGAGMAGGVKARVAPASSNGTKATVTTSTLAFAMDESEDQTITIQKIKQEVCTAQFTPIL